MRPPLRLIEVFRLPARSILSRRWLGAPLVALSGFGSASVFAGCATVTQEDPPSHFAAGGGATTAQSPSSSGGSGTAPITDITAPVDRPARPPAGIDTNPGNPLPPLTGVSNIGAAGAEDAGPQFPSGTTLLQENFENFQSAMGWDTSMGSIWAVETDAELVSNVYTQTETASNTPDLATAGDVAWRDVVVEADLKILGFNGSSSSYMAGLCVRVRDAQNFYLIGIRSNDRKLGLRRYADGGSNLVQSDSAEGTIGVWHQLKVEVVGPSITAFLDGALMFSQTDSTHASGGIALCTVRATASFDNVRVTAP